MAAQQSKELLYDSLIGLARAKRIAGEAGYRNEVFGVLQQARDLDVPQRDLASLRGEAIACMGDFVGLEPRQCVGHTDTPESSSIWFADLHPSDPILAFALRDGTVFIRDLNSIKDIARFEGGDIPRGLCFSSIVFGQ